MIPKRLLLLFLLLFYSILSSLVRAHHSFQAFDMQTTITLEGTLKSTKLTNPHAYFEIEISDHNNQTSVWNVEAVNGSAMRRFGVSDQTFVVGEKISIEAHPARNSERLFAAGQTIRLADGEQFPLSLRSAPRPDVAPKVYYADTIEGVWIGPDLRNGLFFVGAPSVLETWPLTQMGREAVEFYDGSQSPSASCVPYAPPAVNLVPAPMIIKFVDQVVEISIPNEGAIRTIHLNKSSTASDLQPSNQGYSTGSWQDGVLVIETTHFKIHRIGNAFGLPSGPNKRLIERLSLNDDRSKLDYSFELVDPDYLSAPLKHQVQWRYSPDSDIDILDCDPASARKFLEAY